MLEQVKRVLNDILYLDGRGYEFQAETVLLGNVPELDSMAVVSVVTALEDEFGFIVDDDEISADTFATVASLAAFVRAKVENG